MRAAPLVVEDTRLSSRSRLYVMAGSGLALALLVWILTRDKAPASAPEKAEVARVSKLEAKKDIPALVDATKHEDAEVATRAVNAIATVGGSNALDHLQAASRDRRPAVREVAIARYGELTDRENVQVLNDAITRDPSPGVRATAAKSLAQLKSWNGMDTLVSGLNDRDPFVRRCSMDAIQTITGAHFVFDPDGTPEHRAKVMAQVRKEMPVLKHIYDAYMKRQAESGSRK